MGFTLEQTRILSKRSTKSADAAPLMISLYIRINGVHVGCDVFERKMQNPEVSRHNETDSMKFISIYTYF